jgi:Pyruvate/2-oxoacid:ferredoxin oxidoreductase gamma subunit
MEREILMTGIGGQGVQLASQVLARAALAEGKEVQLFGSYAGMMRGGNTDTTLIVADGALDAPPTVDGAWAGVLAHPQFAAPVAARVRAGGIVLRNETLFDDDASVADGVVVLDIAASQLAVSVGHLMTVSMVLLGALAAATSLVARASLVAGLRASLPSYRAQHLALNEAALLVGHDAVADAGVAAW